jgi:hypothetical protein
MLLELTVQPFSNSPEPLKVIPVDVPIVDPPTVFTFAAEFER